jgi:methionyl-tRNA formyltransferase
VRILIIGRNEVLYETAKLLSKTHAICGIITAPASPEYLKNEEDFRSLAQELNCPFLLTKNINAEAFVFIQSANPDLGISVNWVSVIDDKILDLVKGGILNCHPSALPKYRGNAATNWALIMNEKQIGITVHYMQAGELDSGDIIFQELLPISAETTIREINAFWQKVTPGLFLKAANGIEDGSLKRIKQNETGIEPFRAYPRSPIDSKIDWNKSASDIHNIIRASTKPYSGAYTFLKTGNEIGKLIIWESRIICETTTDIGTPGQIILNDRHRGESHIFTGNGIIAISKVQFENGNEFEPGKEWKSIRMRFGIDIEQEIINLLKRFE